jgi:hypothetical protein
MDNNAAWLTLIAALGGVAITAFFGLLTAYYNHRWQLNRLQHESRLVLDRELRAARRETYARYIASANQVYNRSFDLYLVNRDAPKEVDLVASQPGADLIRHLEVNEATRVEVMLLAGSAVRLALESYNVTLQRLWRVVASGTSMADMPASTAAYRALINAMQQEIAGSQA